MSRSEWLILYFLLQENLTIYSNFLIFPWIPWSNPRRTTCDFCLLLHTSSLSLSLLARSTWACKPLMLMHSICKGFNWCSLWTSSLICPDHFRGLELRPYWRNIQSEEDTTERTMRISFNVMTKCFCVYLMKLNRNTIFYSSYPLIVYPRFKLKLVNQPCKKDILIKISNMQKFFLLKWKAKPVYLNLFSENKRFYSAPEENSNLTSPIPWRNFPKVSLSICILINS